MASSLFLLLFVTSIRSEIITDPGTSVVQCNGGEDCTINCNAANTCANSLINCPPRYQCIFSCGVSKSACQQSTINATDSIRLEINDCASGNKFTCTGMTVYVPPNTGGTARAFLNVGDNFNSNSASIHFYAIYGWNDIDTTGYVGTYSSHTGTMHCTTDYSATCAFNTNPDSWSCDASGDTTCDNPPTPQPTTSTPTSSTNNPTSSPTISPLTSVPSISPNTLNPSAVPSSSPTSNPVTLDPSIVPSSSPTIGPTTENSTFSPSIAPITLNPSVSAATDSGITSIPSIPNPTISPVTFNPTIEPTANPSIEPTIRLVTETSNVSFTYLSTTNKEAGSKSTADGLSGAVIAGIICGVFGCIALLVAGAYFATKYHKQLTAQKMEEHFGVQSFKDVMTATKSDGEEAADADGYVEKMKNPVHIASNKGAQDAALPETHININRAEHTSPDDEAPPPPTSVHPHDMQQEDARARAISHPVQAAQDTTRTRSRTQPAVVNAGRHAMYERWSDMFRGGQIGGTQTYFGNPAGSYGGAAAAGTLNAECQLVSPRRVKSEAFPADIDINFVIGSPVTQQHQIHQQHHAMQHHHQHHAMQHHQHHAIQQQHHAMQHQHHHANTMQQQHAAYIQQQHHHHHAHTMQQHAQPPNVPQQQQQQQQQDMQLHASAAQHNDDEAHEESHSHDISEDSDSHHTYTKFDTKQSMFQTLPRMHTEWIEHDIAMHHDPQHPQMQNASGVDLDQDHEWSDSHHTYTRFDTQQSMFNTIPRMDTELLAHDIDLHHAQNKGLNSLEVIKDVNDPQMQRDEEEKQVYLTSNAKIANNPQLVQQQQQHDIQRIPETETTNVSQPAPAPAAAYTDNANAQQQFGLHMMQNLAAHQEHDRIDTVLSDLTDITEMNLEYGKNVSFKD